MGDNDDYFLFSLSPLDQVLRGHLQNQLQSHHIHYTFFERRIPNIVHRLNLCVQTQNPDETKMRNRKK